LAVRNSVASVRKSRGFTAAELAKRVGVIRQTIYAIEAGSYVPNTEVALRLSRVLETPIDTLFQLDPGEETEDTNQFAAEYLSTHEPVKGQAVRTGRVGDTWISVPVSAAPYHLPEADGVVAALGRRGNRPKVHGFFQDPSVSKRLVLAGCDPAANLLAHMVERIGGVEVVQAPASSQLALDWLHSGKVHIAGSHLEDPKTGEFNLPFVRRQFARQDMAMVTFAEWEAGFVVAAGNPKNIRSVEDLTNKKLRFINREPGSGSRALLDKLLERADLSSSSIAGYDEIAAGHLAAAYAIFANTADCCIATQSAARAYRLNFIPLHLERYDFVLPKETLELPQIQTFLDVLQRATLRRKLETLAGYDTSRTGTILA
jgi:molybdate-binding protein/DNA-binding XRE family transcriptional regulator